MTAAAHRPDEVPPPTDPARRFAALRGCDRILSGARPRTLRERLAALSEGAEELYDLDEGPDFYGDGIVRALERRVAGLLGLPEAVYFPTGTMAQQAALQYWADGAGRTVAMHPLAHPEVHEQRAYSVLSGLRTVWPTGAPRLPTAAELRSVGEAFTTLMIELPLRDAGFVLPTWAELTAVVDEARRQGAFVHLDGARLWESGPHFGRSLPEIAGLADSVYVSCYKTLGGTSGALVAGDAEFARGVRIWRHRYGGRLFQQWPAVLTALAGLERELPRLDSYVANAKAVAAALAEVPGARVNPDPPHTHQFRFWLPYPAQALNRATVRLAEEQGVGLFGTWDEPGPLPGFSMTEVTASAAALDWTPREVSEAVALFLEFVED
ncbi:threonine aldolase family protein [Kitasatospora sp. NPDC088346]|uniref:threonine aldolase family protein n=1 Tax=Kitasatospora sp. NPDC088346 TaxID=3364073 RepID=UPI00381F1298